MSIARLTMETNVTRQAVTRHLGILADAGLVRGSRKGRESHWEIEPDRLQVAREHLARISDQWDATLDRLKKFVES